MTFAYGAFLPLLKSIMVHDPSSGNVLFILLGAILVLAMHAGFAFLELGTVRKKNQVNALSKIITDFSVSAIASLAVLALVSAATRFSSSALWNAVAPG